jgi:glycosyltransferase involved in cell wall biosynthesis
VTPRFRLDEPVTVVIPVFDRVGLLADAVESALAQDHELELVIIDDGSTDGTSELADRLAAGDERAWVVHQANAGPGTARNVGLRLARHRLVANHDSDDLMLAGRLAGQVAALAERPDAGAVVSMARSERIEGSDTPQHVLLRFGDLDPASLCTMLLDRDRALAVGGYSTDLRLGEDTELLVRLHEAGYPFVRHHEVVVVRRFHDSNLVAEDVEPDLTLLSLMRRHLERGRDGTAPDR